MENKSSKPLLVLVVILLIIAGFLAYYKNLPLKDDYSTYPPDVVVDGAPRDYTQTRDNANSEDYSPN